jgi:hypothetical protein
LREERELKILREREINNFQGGKERKRKLKIPKKFLLGESKTTNLHNVFKLA